MEIMNMLAGQRMVQQSSAVNAQKSAKPGSASFSDVLSKAGKVNGANEREKLQKSDKSISDKSVGQKPNPEREKTVDREAPKSEAQKAPKNEKPEATLAEKLEELEAAIDAGDSEAVGEIFAELISFLGIQMMDGELQNLDMEELKLQAGELIAKLEELLSNVAEGTPLTEVDLKAITSGLDMMKELIARQNGEVPEGFEEISLKLQALEDELKELSSGMKTVDKPETAETVEEIFEESDETTQKLDREVNGKDGSDGRSGEEAEIKASTAATGSGTAEGGGSISEAEEGIGSLKEAVKNSGGASISENMTDPNSKLEFEKVFISQNMRSEMNHNMHKVINSEVHVEQNYLNMDKLDIIKQISAKMKLNGGDSVNEINIKLTPESLGELNVKVTLERGIISARAIVENPYVKQIMESNMAELRQNLKSQGIEFDQLEVFVGEDPREKSGEREGLFDQSGNRRRRKSSFGVDGLDLEEAGKILEEDIVSSEKVDASV